MTHSCSRQTRRPRSQCVPPSDFMRGGTNKRRGHVDKGPLADLLECFQPLSGRYHESRGDGKKTKQKCDFFFLYCTMRRLVAAGGEDAPLGSTGIFVKSLNDAFALQRRSDRRTSLKWKPREPLNGTYIRTGQRRQQHALSEEITHPTQSLLVRHNYL